MKHYVLYVVNLSGHLLFWCESMADRNKCVVAAFVAISPYLDYKWKTVIDSDAQNQAYRNRICFGRVGGAFN